MPRSSRCSSNPPPYAKYDWKSAFEFHSISLGWPISWRLKEDWRFAKAFLKIADWNAMSKAIHARQRLSRNFQRAKSLRHQATRAVLQNEEIEGMLSVIFCRLADSMNELEFWTDYQFEIQRDKWPTIKKDL